MGDVKNIQQYGNLLKITYGDGSVDMAVPTQGGLWLVTAANTGGGGGGGGTGQFSWPFSLSNVSSEYGPRTGPIGSFHEGIDFSGGSAVTGAKEFATNAGTVEKINLNSNYGFSVQLFHGVTDNGYGLHTIYAHMTTNPLVGVGDAVTKGQLLGYLGSSGDATGPHLHFETHTCPNNGPIVHNTSTPIVGLQYRTAINPRDFMTAYGDGAVFPQ
jgi:murein DD-endopeptidase MepM/ murein hydrolase activator NlpD